MAVAGVSATTPLMKSSNTAIGGCIRSISSEVFADGGARRRAMRSSVP
jgi:hypothetical protein